MMYLTMDKIEICGIGDVLIGPGGKCYLVLGVANGRVQVKSYRNPSIFDDIAMFMRRLWWWIRDLPIAKRHPNLHKYFKVAGNAFRIGKPLPLGEADNDTPR